MTGTRYTYAFGYKSREHAETALEELFAGGEISPCENPRIESYVARICAPTSTGKTTVKRFSITLVEGV